MKVSADDASGIHGTDYRE